MAHASRDDIQWTPLRSYDVAHQEQIAMPVGGIGTGCVAIGGRGQLTNFELVNRPAKGFRPSVALFAVTARKEGEQAGVVRLLEGPLAVRELDGADGSRAANHNWPRFRDSLFETAYPFARVTLKDPDVPVVAALEAFNPLIPGDANGSGIPIAILRYRLTNVSSSPLEVTVSGHLSNFVGTDGVDGSPTGGVNEWRESERLCGIYMNSPTLASDDPMFGSLALATTHPAAQTSHRAGWTREGWSWNLLSLWDDLQDGRLEAPAPGKPITPIASLAAASRLAPGESSAVTFLLAWHFPNRLSWTPDGNVKALHNGRMQHGQPVIGNYYTERYIDAWDVAARTAAELPELEAKTTAFVNAFTRSDLPDAVKEAALFNLSTLKTQTCLRTPDGRFFGYEGVFEQHGSCHGSCTHVWNYELATHFLFGDLARTMREVEFAHATRDDGHMSFRVHLPLAEHATKGGLAAADGQMGCIVKLHRDWTLCGDDGFLRALWPKARKALEFCWIPGGWDGDRDGVMEGCQHNTMDVEYFGPNPQMQGWYLAALRAAEEMASHLGEVDFAKRCADLFRRGCDWMDSNLFNGEYYEHQVRPPLAADSIAPGLAHRSLSSSDLSDPNLQLGAGCLVDQLVGQAMAHVGALGYLHDPANVRATLRAILQHNRKRGFWDHFNPMRSYVANDETAVLMASYPRGSRPRLPFPYFGEVMTGFEYVLAVGLLYEGFIDEGVAVISDIRARYDGRKRNPFDEAECGRHYARAMASWGAVLALSGFRYDAREGGTITFAPSKPRRVDFWSNGEAWGTFERVEERGDSTFVLTVLHGELRVARVQVGEKQFELRGGGVITSERPLAAQAR